MSVDFSGLQKLSQQLRTAEHDLREEFFDRAVNLMTARVLRKVTKREFDHKKTGNLVKGYRPSPVQKGARKRKAYIYNNVYYASYVEYGHRHYRKGDTKGNPSGWTEGRFSLQKSGEEVEKEAPKILQKELNEFVRKKLDGAK